MTKRDSYPDNIKLFLILLVVLGHTLTLGASHPSCHAVYEWIYTFHMPLFVFISGYFTRISNSEKFWKGVLQIAETFAIFSVIHIFILYLQHEPIGWHTLIIPRWTLWYLLSLIWWRLMLCFTPKKITEKCTILLDVSLILYLVMGFVPLNKELSFQRTFGFLPFFLMGYVAGQRQMIRKLRIHPVLATIVLIGMVVALFLLNPREHALMFLDYSYAHYHHSTLFMVAFRIGYLAVACLMSVCILSVIPTKGYRWTHFGQLTLFIYMWHSVILSWRRILCDTYHLPTTLPFCLLYAAMVVALIYVMSKIRLFHWILNPISKTLNYLKTR